MSNTIETEIVKNIYEALNKNDIAGVVKYFDPEIVRVEWEGTPSEGTFRGLSEVTAHFTQGRSTWEEGGCFPQELIVEGNNVTAMVHVRVRQKNKTEWNEGRIRDVWTFRDQKVIKFQSYFK